MVNEKWILLQPTYHNGVQIVRDLKYSIDPFVVTSNYFQCPLYNIQDHSIPLNADVYWLVHFSINDLQKEIDFVKKVKELEKKTFLTFSHDLRFYVGDGLLNSEGTLWTELCKEVDGIGAGVADDLKIFGRYQDKVIPFGDILLPVNFYKPYENRSIDVLVSGPPGEQFLSFSLETLLLIKEKFPNKRIVCLVQKHHANLIQKLRIKYPEIEFPLEDVQPLLYYMKDTKVYFNAELRPRPGRAMMEAFYCRTPFICCSSTYFSRLCKEYAYDKMSIVDIVDTYGKLLQDNFEDIKKRMEERAEFDYFKPIYNRVKKQIGI